MAEQKITIPITGMTCANCAMNIERVINANVPGIINASVNFASERALIEYVPSYCYNTQLDPVISRS